MTGANLFGDDLFGESVKPTARGPILDKFLIPPFTILDAKQGAWLERKRAWIAMGIVGELGRDDNLAYTIPEEYNPGFSTGTSVFDPVLCELSYRWWCPQGGQVVDPFAGGSVRGIIATTLGLNYWGCDLAKNQVAANLQQAKDIGVATVPTWILGDSAQMLAHSPPADFIFSCPPYGNLEVYSDDKADLSQMDWPDFVKSYRVIIERALDRLKRDRFACFVVGDFRDKKGFYRDFVSTTIRAFEDGGARLYNEAILATSIGSAGMRVGRQFTSGRKLAKVHQNLLVFCKGDWKRATLACGEINNT